MRFVFALAVITGLGTLMPARPSQAHPLVSKPTHPTVNRVKVVKLNSVQQYTVLQGQAGFAQSTLVTAAVGHYRVTTHKRADVFRKPIHQGDQPTVIRGNRTFNVEVTKGNAGFDQRDGIDVLPGSYEVRTFKHVDITVKPAHQ